MQKIELGQGKFALVDDKDFEYLNQFKWHLGTEKSNSQYAIRHIRINGKRTTIAMHKVILNNPAGTVSDHINGNGLDNRRENLRICTVRNNCMNRKQQGGTSKYKGVSLHSPGGKWKSRIKTNGKTYNLGCYKTQEEAASVYNIAAKIMFGNFANPNQIGG